VAIQSWLFAPTFLQMPSLKCSALKLLFFSGLSSIAFSRLFASENRFSISETIE